MAKTPTVPKKILLPTDLSGQARGALRYASALAQHTGAELHILHVLTLHGYDPMLAQSVLDGLQEAFKSLEAELKQQMDDHAARLVPSAVTVRTALRRSMSPYDAILNYASEEDIDLIVMATSGKTGLNYVLLGSVTEKVVEYADLPVLVVNERERDFVDQEGKMLLRRILYPTDFSPASRKAASIALHMAQEAGADILLTNVIEAHKHDVELIPPDAAKADENLAPKLDLLQREARLLFGDQVPVRLRLGRGPVPNTLVATAREDAADLIVLSSQGEDSFVDRLLGSVAERLLRLAPCPMLVVKVDESNGADD